MEVLMEINRAIHGNKNYLILALLELLKKRTDSDNPLEKKEIRDILKKEYGITMSRNTLDEKFKALEDAGYEIGKNEKGWYLISDGITDGELRILIDSILYSDILNQSYSKELIEKLSELGSVSFRKYVKTLKYRTENIKKSQSYDTVNIIEIIQSAIFKKRLISLNYITYRKEFVPTFVYDEDIIVSPYELAFSGGRYYLICAKNKEDNLIFLRVDRLANVKLLETPSHEAEKIRNIKKNGSIAEYIDKQPELCGGHLELFIIACHKDALDDFYDAFGKRAKLFPEFDEECNDPDILTLQVETTREAIKYWAIMHSDKIVIITPKDMRNEIRKHLLKSHNMYIKTGSDLYAQRNSATNIDEAIHAFSIIGDKRFYYSSHEIMPEKLDMSLFDKIKNAEEIALYNCDLTNIESFSSLTDLKLLDLRKCEFNPELLNSCTNLAAFYVSNCSNQTVRYIKKMRKLREIRLFDLRLTDLSFLKNCKKLFRIDLVKCDLEYDLSCLEDFPELRYLTISDCNFVTEDLIMEIKKALPKCEIFWNR